MREDARSDMAHTKRGYRFEKDWPPEHLEHIAQNYKAGTTIPVDVRIEGKHHVLNMENVRRILSTARIISVMDCGCRTIYRHCDAPLNVCLDLNEVAERHMAIGWAREITLDEALDVLERTHEAGLVHMAYGHGEFYEPGVINSVCSCCSCCCGIFSGVLRFGRHPPSLRLTLSRLRIPQPVRTVVCASIDASSARERQRTGCLGSIRTCVSAAAFASAPVPPMR